MLEYQTEETQSAVNIPALALNTAITGGVASAIAGLCVLNNSMHLTPVTVDFSVQTANLILGLVLFSKTSVDGVLLMTNVISKSVNGNQVGAAIAATTIVNGLATALIGGLWLAVSDSPSLVYSIIIAASVYLLYLAYEGYMGLRSHEDGEENTPKENYEGKSSLAVGLIAAADLALLYGDGAAANMELLSKVNFTSLTLGMIVGQFILSTAVLLVPKQKVDALASNFTFHVVGILAFVGLGLYGFYEAFEGISHHYGSAIMAALQSLIG
ncbi:MAG: hypothetical protein ACRCXZ_04275 [Patescibacteria group bacterium]